MAQARLDAGPDEEKRIKRVKEVAELVKELKEDHDAKLNILQEVDQKLTRANDAARTADARARDLDKALAFLKTAEISGLLSELVKELETMRLKKQLSFNDGDNLAKLAGDFRTIADERALGNAIPQGLRGDYADGIAAWGKAVRTAESCALQVASAGSSLSLNLLR
jgi:hypothetical protein